MTFSRTAHRFAGGALALDVANSVILRHDPTKRVDRFGVPRQLEEFAEAAMAFSAERDLFGKITPLKPTSLPPFMSFREAVDGYFRTVALGQDEPSLLAELLRRGALLLCANPAPRSLETQVVHSALRLVALPGPTRMKICGNCGWLFLDRSKNKSRLWCDMSVCGNRMKAARHYRKRMGGEAE